MLKSINKLCYPAYVYLVISVISIVFIYLQNINNGSVYCIGNLECETPNKIMVFIIKAVYIVFWTWVLQLICKSGWTSVSWILVMIPFFSMFLMIMIFMMTSSGNVPILIYSSPI